MRATVEATRLLNNAGALSMGSPLLHEMKEVLPSTTANSVADNGSGEWFAAAAVVNARLIVVRVEVSRLQQRRSRQTFTDGPFAESKELIGGNRPPNASRR